MPSIEMIEDHYSCYSTMLDHVGSSCQIISPAAKMIQHQTRSGSNQEFYGSCQWLSPVFPPPACETGNSLKASGDKRPIATGFWGMTMEFFSPKVGMDCDVFHHKSDLFQQEISV